MNRALREKLYPLYCAITGRGGDFLVRKREFHRRRATMERSLLDEAKSDPAVLEPNGCPACGSSTDSRPLFSNKTGFSFFHCSDDGTVYVNPVPSATSLKRLYNDSSMSFNHIGERSVETFALEPTNREDYKSLLRMVGPVTGKPRLLEVGCSTGGFLKTASESFDAEGVELNDTTAGVARHNGFRVRTGRLSDIPGENIFSVIVMLQVLEHIVDPKEVMDDIKRLLLPDGFLFVSLPNIDSASFEYLGRLHTHVSSFAHVSLYNKQSLVRMASRCGLEVLAHEYCDGRDLDLSDALSLWISKDNFYHRMALYSPRLYYSSKVLNWLTLDLFSKLIFPSGNQSYQRALLRKPIEQD